MKVGYELCIYCVLRFPSQLILLKNLIENRPNDEIDLLLKVNGLNWHN